MTIIYLPIYPTIGNGVQVTDGYIYASTPQEMSFGFVHRIVLLQVHRRGDRLFAQRATPKCHAIFYVHWTCYHCHLYGFLPKIELTLSDFQAYAVYIWNIRSFKQKDCLWP